MKLTGIAKQTLHEYNRISLTAMTNTLKAHDLLSNKNTAYSNELLLMWDFYNELLSLVQKFESRVVLLENVEPNVEQRA